MWVPVQTAGLPSGIPVEIFDQDGLQVCFTARQFPLMQSVPARQDLFPPHLAHVVPPQSTSVSRPLRVPSWQAVATQTNEVTLQ